MNISDLFLNRISHDCTIYTYRINKTLTVAIPALTATPITTPTTIPATAPPDKPPLVDLLVSFDCTSGVGLTEGATGASVVVAGDIVLVSEVKSGHRTRSVQFSPLPTLPIPGEKDVYHNTIVKSGIITALWKK